VIERISYLDFSYSYSGETTGEKLALRDVNLKDINLGEIVCLVGGNGAGKSTFIKQASGLLPRLGSRGKIVFDDGFEVSPGDRSRITSVYIPQSPREGFVPALNVEENLLVRRIAAKGRGISLKTSSKDIQKLHNFLSSVGIDWSRRRLESSPEELSGGQQQLMNLLSALFCEPDVLLLDEPTRELDEVNKVRIWRLIVEACEKAQVRVVYATHDHQMALRVADRIVHLRKGSIIRKPHYPRLLGGKRSVGHVRVFEKKEEAVAWSGVQSDWWTPGRGQLFGEAYREGDDSLEGYMAGRILSREARTQREISGVMWLLSLERGSRIIDIPCGWGRHSLGLSQFGYDVMGFDINPVYIRDADTVATAQALSATFKVHDMRGLPIPDGSADAVLNLWTSFGFFENTGDDALTLKEWARVLKPNGRILIHTDLNPRRVRHGVFDESPNRVTQTGCSLEVIEYYCREDQRVYGRWKVESPTGTAKGPYGYSIRIYGEDEWTTLAEGSGLEVQAFYGALEPGAEQLTDSSQEFVIVLRKP